MTAADMRSYFDLIQDKTSEPSFTDLEKNEYLDAAQMSFLNELVGGNDYEIQSPLELDERIVRLISPLIVEEFGLLDTTGVILYSGLASTPVRVLRLANSSQAVIRFVRYNDWDKIITNTYTAPNGIHRCIYTYASTGVKVEPSGQTDWDISYIREPQSISLGDCEFPASTHYKIVAKALDQAGISTEAEALLAIEENTK